MTHTPLPTVLLFHDWEPQSHYDWLLADPATWAQPDEPVTTFRVAIPSRQWAKACEWDLTPLPPHSRLYMAYEGPIDGNRGSVRRVDKGMFEVDQWSSERIVIDVALRAFTGRVELTRREPQRWHAVVR